MKLIALMSMCFIFVSTIISNATFMSYGYPTPSFYVYPFISSSGTWGTAVNNSISSWNNAVPKVNIRKSTSSTNALKVSSYSDSWYGLAKQYRNSSGKVIKFEVYGNTRTVTRDAYNKTNFMQSVLVHEFGHILWLADNPNTLSSSIMKYSRNRNTMTKPQTYDINDVKRKFP